jgi:uncharacterized membrane protein YkvA (DUF1232 family)
MHLHTLLVALAITAAVWLLAIGVLLAFGRVQAAKELAGLIPNLLLLFKDLVKDPRVPRSAKVWLVVAALWLASPIDLLPEFLPVIGPLDDAIVAAAVLRHLVKKAGPDVVYEHWRGDPTTIARVLRIFGTSDAPVETKE